MMKSPSPIGDLQNVQEQPSHRYLLNATLSDMESEKNLTKGFKKRQRSIPNNVIA